MRAVVLELKELVLIATPIILSNACSTGMQLTDLAFVGQELGPTGLAIGAIGNTLFSLIWYPTVGAMTSLDTMMAQAWGRAKSHPPAAKLVGSWMQIGFVTVTVMTLPGLAFLSFAAEPFALSVLSQSVTSSIAIGSFVRVLAVSVVPFLAFSALSKFLVAQGIVWPGAIISGVAFLANIAFNTLFLTVLDMGTTGAATATLCSRLLQLLMIVIYVSCCSRHKDSGTLQGRVSCSDAFSPVTWCCVVPRSFPTVLEPDADDDDGADVKHHTVSMEPAVEESPPDSPFGKPISAQGRSFLLLAASGMLMMALESWCFEFSTFLAARLGETALDAHVVLLNVAGFTFLVFPFGIAVASTVRVGNLLGQGDATRAKAAATAALLLGTVAMVISALLIALGASDIGRLFTQEQSVVTVVASLAPICALFQVVDGLQGTSAGVLRGMGRQATVAAANIGGFWIAGLPVGAALTFAAGLGVAGLWWGLLSGLTVSSVTFVCVLLRVDWQKECLAAAERIGGTASSISDQDETQGLVVAGSAPDTITPKDASESDLLVDTTIPTMGDVELVVTSV